MGNVESSFVSSFFLPRGPLLPILSNAVVVILIAASRPKVSDADLRRGSAPLCGRTLDGASRPSIPV